MKSFRIFSGVVLLGCLLVTSANYAQVRVENHTCHSMFVYAQWGTNVGNPACTPCSGCAASGVVAPGSGTIGSTGPTGTDVFLNCGATLNSFSGCSLTQGAWLLCSGAAQNGISSCCTVEWMVSFDGSGTVVIEEL